MVILDLLEGVTPTVDVWKYAYSTCGELCVITTGPAQMPEWHANSWDTLATVSSWLLQFINYSHGVVHSSNVLQLCHC